MMQARAQNWLEKYGVRIAGPVTILALVLRSMSAWSGGSLDPSTWPHVIRGALDIATALGVAVGFEIVGSAALLAWKRALDRKAMIQADPGMKKLDRARALASQHWKVRLYFFYAVLGYGFTVAGGLYYALVINHDTNTVFALLMILGLVCVVSFLAVFYEPHAPTAGEIISAHAEEASIASLEAIRQRMLHNTATNEDYEQAATASQDPTVRRMMLSAVKRTKIIGGKGFSTDQVALRLHVTKRNVQKLCAKAYTAQMPGIYKEGSEFRINPVGLAVIATGWVAFQCGLDDASLAATASVTASADATNAQIDLMAQKA